MSVMSETSLNLEASKVETFPCYKKSLGWFVKSFCVFKANEKLNV